MAETSRDKAIMHGLVARYGGHGVTIIRKGERLVGWSAGRTGSGIAIRDLIEIVEGYKHG